MRIIGIDPGTSLLGFGVIDYSKQKLTMLDCGTIKTASNIKNKDRVETIYNSCKMLYKRWKPDIVALEELFFFKNAKTVIQVSEIRGVLLLSASLHNIKIREFTPLQVKQAVSGYGRADKKQVQEMVKLILRLDTIPKPDDAADALALAICCAHTIVY